MSNKIKNSEKIKRYCIIKKEQNINRANNALNSSNVENYNKFMAQAEAYADVVRFIRTLKSQV